MFTDQLFRWIALVSGLLVLAILALIAYTTTKNAWPWFRAEGFGILAATTGIRPRGSSARVP